MWRRGQTERREGDGTESAVAEGRSVERTCVGTG